MTDGNRGLGATAGLSSSAGRENTAGQASSGTRKSIGDYFHENSSIIARSEATKQSHVRRWRLLRFTLAVTISAHDFLIQIVSLVIYKDESGEVHDFDPPDRFHT